MCSTPINSPKVPYVAERLGEEAREGAGGVQRGDDEDQQGSGSFKVDGRGEEEERREKGQGQGADDTVHGKASSDMRVFLKPYVCEKAQSAGMETYISKPNEMAQCIFQQRNLDLLTKSKTCVYGTYLFMYMWVLEFCL